MEKSMIVVQSLSLIFWLLILPFCIGLIPMQWILMEKRNIGVVSIAGYLLMLPLCWVATVPCVILVKYDSFLTMAGWFTALLGAAGVLGIALTVVAVKRKRWVSLMPSFHRWRDISLEEKIEWALFLGLLAFQLYKAFTLTSFDGDDAEYVAQSLVTQQSNTMYLIKPYTGGTTSLDIRHALAVLPIWIAYIGRVTGIHTTILAHTVLPLLFIPLTYAAYYEVGKRLFKEKKEFLPAFMTAMSLLQIFGNVSIYTNETFFLTRTWQGKSLAANFVLAVILWLLLAIFDDGEKEASGDKDNKLGLWLLLAFANMTAGVCTSMAVFLCGMLIAVAAFWVMVAKRRLDLLVKAGIVCIPNAVYMLLYLFLH